MLKKLANNLPMINQCSHEQHLMTGAEILAWNTMTEIDGEKINPDKKYLIMSNEKPKAEKPKLDKAKIKAMDDCKKKALADNKIIKK